METSTEEIRRELDHKRDALTRDVERLEAKVKQTFSLNAQISERPLLSVGLAAIGGFVLGSLGSGHSGARGNSSAYAHGARTGGGAVTPYGSALAGGTWSAQPASPGLLDQVKAGFRDSMHGGGGTNTDAVLATITAALTALLVDKAKEVLDQNMPGFAAQFDRVSEPAGSDRQHEQRASYPASAMGPSPHPDPLASAASTTAATSPLVGQRPASGQPI
jgi:hypothetical protein